MSFRTRPTAKRPRNSWFLNSCSILGVHQVQAWYKNTKGSIQPLTTSKPNAPVKVSFGPPTSCELRVRKQGVEVVTEFKFVNKRKESIALRDSILNSLEAGVNSFSKRVTSLSTEDPKKKLLALFLSVINFSKGFVHHREDFHDDDGFEITGEGISKRYIEAAGGSIEELRKFVEAAKDSAIIMDAPDPSQNDISQYFQTSSKKRKGSEEEPKAPKLTKKETIDEHEKQELEEETGLEKLYQGSFICPAYIPLDNISISPEMQVLVNDYRVRFITTSMRNKYDPSKSVLVVCTEDDGVTFDGKNVDGHKYIVVQKLHCFKAFKELDKTGDLVTKPGHKDRKVLCYVLKPTIPELRLYGNTRENLISDQCARKVFPQDLLHIFNCLKLKDSNVKSLKVVERMSKLCRIGPDEVTALGKICKWSTPAFEALMAVVIKFEKYETNDVKKTGHQQRLARGEKLTISNVLLRSLGKCSEKYFIAHHDKVLDSTISLKDLAENFKEAIEVEKVTVVLSLISEYESVEVLRANYPGKFEFDNMKPFVGAVFKGEVKNMKTLLLEKYYNSVVADPEEVVKDPVEFVPFKTVTEVTGDLELLDKFEMIVFNMKLMNKDFCMNIIQIILGNDKLFNAAIVVFPSELNQFEVLSYLRGQQATTSLVKDFKIVPLLFKKNAFVTCDDVGENVRFALLFGKLTVLKSPLLVHYSDLVQLSQVVDSVCPPQMNVAMITDPGAVPVKIHNRDLDRRITYFGTEVDIYKFKKKLSMDKTPVLIFLVWGVPLPLFLGAYL